MRVSFTQFLANQLELKETVTQDVEVDGLGRFIHIIDVENHKTIKRVKILADENNSAILKITDETSADKKEVLWEDKTLTLFTTKLLMSDLIEKITTENIHFSVSDNHMNSPYKFKVTFSKDASSSILDKMESYLSLLSEDYQISYKRLGTKNALFEPVPSDSSKKMLYEAGLDLPDVIEDLKRMGFVHNA